MTPVALSLLHNDTSKTLNSCTKPRNNHSVLGKNCDSEHLGMRRVPFFLALVVLFCAVLVGEGLGVGYGEEETGWQKGGGGGGGEEGGAGRRGGEDRFLLRDSRYVAKTDAGVFRVVSGFGGRFMRNPMHIGFITMEPKSLLIPQYLDSSLIFFVRRGEARLGHIYKDELVEKRLKTGDIYRVAAGMPFYLINTAEGQRLHVICSIDASDNMGLHSFQSFYIGGGIYPASVLSGFDPITLSTAFNVSVEEVGELFSRQLAGPIVFYDIYHSPSIWTKFLNLEIDQKMAHLKRIVHIGGEGRDGDGGRKQSHWWSLRKFLMRSLFGKRDKKKGGKRGKSEGLDSYNIYGRKPDFSNDYGSSIALDESDYEPLRHSDFGVYLVNLTAGSMMAPHLNPRATEYGIVLRGSGTIQVVNPNGSLAMNAKVNEGDVFFIPQYFPFCQIASRTSPFEFFGFTTSASNNNPQYLAGATSVLKLIAGPELAAAFGMNEERLKEILNAQNVSTILPSAAVSPPEVTIQVGYGKTKKAEGDGRFRAID